MLDFDEVETDNSYTIGVFRTEEPYASLSLIASAYWFGYFLVILPLLGVLGVRFYQGQQ